VTMRLPMMLLAAFSCAALLPVTGAHASMTSSFTAYDLGSRAVQTSSTRRAAREMARTGSIARDDITAHATLSSDDYFDFSGIGAIVCSVGEQHWASTAFFVGAFDIMVTSADAFTRSGVRASADQCVYTNSDSQGRFREQIPLAYFKSQWELEDGAFGDRARDLAVVKLSEQSAYAQKTMALAKFDGQRTKAFVVAFPSDMDVDTMKTKAVGIVYPSSAQTSSGQASHPDLYSHDIVIRGIAPGAPVINSKTGAIIGLCPNLSVSTTPQHKAPAAVNDLVPMNAWLETTLRAELKMGKTKNASGADTPAAPSASNSSNGATSSTN
jgi:hypothetical protein